MTHRAMAFGVLAALWALAAVGCSSGASSGGGSDTSGGGSAFQPLEPFQAPPLDELDRQVQWVPGPVLDSMKLRRQRIEAQREFLVAEEEALQMRNDSPEANRKIMSVLGRLPRDESEVDYEASITRRLTMDVSSLNPLLGSSVAEFEISGLTGFGLFSFDWEMTPFASSDSVREWYTSADGLYDKVVMRDDLTWSDGTPITAHDVVFTFQTLMDPEVAPNIPAIRSGVDEIRWIEAYDDHTLVFFHKQPLVTNVWNINFPIVPRHVYEKVLAEDKAMRNGPTIAALERKPIVGGAYELVERERGQHIVLRRREAYYMHNGKQVRDKPHFREIRFEIIEDGNTALLSMRKGELHEGELQAEQWATQTLDDDFYRHNTKVSGAEATYFYIGWNLRTPYFDDYRVRRAMAYAMDYRTMLDQLCYGLYEQCRGTFAPGQWMTPDPLPDPYVQDLDKARELLREAGWQDTDRDGVLDKDVGGRRIPFRFQLLVSNKPDRIRICDLFRRCVEELGIECEVVPLEAATLQERVFRREYQAQFSGWGAGADPDTSENIFGTGQGRNYGGYSNAMVDDLFKAGKREFDRQKRADIYAQIHRLIWADQPYLFLYNRASFYGFNKKLRGYMFSSRGPFHYGPGFSAIWAIAQ